MGPPRARVIWALTDLRLPGRPQTSAASVATRAVTRFAVDMTASEKTPLLKNAPKASQAMRRHNLRTFKVDVKTSGVTSSKVKGLEKNMPLDLKVAGVMTESEYREIEEIIVQTFKEFNREATWTFAMYFLSLFFSPSWLCCVPCIQIQKYRNVKNPVESDQFEDVLTKLGKQYEERRLTFKMVWTSRVTYRGNVVRETGWQLEVQALLDN